ncbi:ParB N-terminal domain-containing protein [Aurantiacibacter hainanensis]|uniref:ParB N-terminal domain-containing protein n=1 Tax=Aurantiacibacter hainanensis TaxID=3076114 RepID=UPI0030C6F7FB
MTTELLEAEPSELQLDEINQAPAVFQVRYDSLAFSPGQSAKHVENLSKAIRSDGALDPVSVAAFGNKWYLLDGHHRIEAYQRTGWHAAIPVRPFTSPERGLPRVLWAQSLSLAENKKDRLNISGADRQDAAWRAVLQDFGSISEIASMGGVSRRQVSNMRQAKTALLEAGHKLPRLMSWGWRQAMFERRRLDDDGPSNFDFQEKLRRDLAKRVKAALDLRPPAATLLEMLEAMRPGISLELETVIHAAKKESRNSEPKI